MEVVDKIEELPNLPAKMLGNHHLKSHILHSIDVVGHQHIIGALRQGRIQIDFSINTTYIKHSLKGAWKQPICLFESLVIPERNDIAAVPRVGFQLFEKLIDNVVFLNNGTIALTDGSCIFHFPVIPVVNIVLAIQNL